MHKSQLTGLTLEVSIENATQDEVDQMTRQLLAELKESDVKSARLTKDSTASTGSKGDTTTIGSIIIKALMRARAARSKGRIVNFRGKGIEFDRSAEELRNVLEKLDKGKGRK